MRISDWSSDVCSSDLRIALAVPVTASISGRCGFSTPPDTNVELCNLEACFSRDIPFVLQCNTPMRLAMVSQNGGLKVASAPPEGFTNLLDYTVTLHAVGTGGTSIVASCSASSLAAAAILPCSFRGTASATTGLRLSGVSHSEQGSYLRVFAPPTSGRVQLMASTEYKDVLVLTLSPST